VQLGFWLGIHPGGKVRLRGQLPERTIEPGWIRRDLSVANLGYEWSFRTDDFDPCGPGAAPHS